MKRISLIFCACLIALVANAQENGEKFNLSVDVASGFVWRGMPINTTPVVQPSITFTQGIFSIGTWASTSFDSYEHQEFDIFVELEVAPSSTLGLISYYGYSPYGNYFDFKKETTGHAFDLYFRYNSGSGFKATLSTIIGGNDLKWKDGELKRNFSTYMELGYGSTTTGGIDWEIFAGLVPMKSGFYAIDGAAFMNLGLGVSKSFEVTPTYTLPLSLKLSFNPAYDAAFLTAAIALF